MIHWTLVWPGCGVCTGLVLICAPSAVVPAVCVPCPLSYTQPVTAVAMSMGAMDIFVRSFLVVI